jgi:hypothetical protein
VDERQVGTGAIRGRDRLQRDDGLLHRSQRLGRAALRKPDVGERGQGECVIARARGEDFDRGYPG